MNNPGKSNSKIGNLFFKNIYYPLHKVKSSLNLSRPRVSFPLEIQLADHCNLNCIGCSHYSPISDKKFASPLELEKSLKVLAKFKVIFEEIRLLGGEPLLNPECVTIMRLVRKYFPSTEIHIVTNGILLLNEKVCGEEFWKTMRECNIELSVTEYPINLNYQEIGRIASENQIKFNFYGSHKVYEDGSKDFKLFLLDEKKNHNKLNFFRCPDSIICQLVDGKLFMCAQSAYVDKLNKKFDTDFKHTKNDYLDIDKLNWLNLLAFLNKPKDFCKYCTFPFKDINWALSGKEKSEWVEEQASK